MLSVKVSLIARSTFKTHDTSLVNFSPRLPGLPAGHGGLRTEVLRAPAETEVGKMTFLIESGLLPLPRCHVIRQGLRSQARPSPLYRAAAFKTFIPAFSFPEKGLNFYIYICPRQK